MIILECKLKSPIGQNSFVVELNTTDFDSVFPAGMQLVIDPELTPTHGNIALITFEPRGPTTLVKYRQAGDKLFFEMLEKGLPNSFEVTPKTAFNVCGVAVWKELKGEPLI